MINTKQVHEREVIAYWRKLEKCSEPNPLRPQILDASFPAGVRWLRGQLSHIDVANLFMIPANDFDTLSMGTWRLPEAAGYFADHFASGTYDPQNPYHADKIGRLLRWPERLTSPLI